MTIRLDTRLPARLWLPTRTAGPRRGLRAVSVSRPVPARGPYSALLPVGLAVPVRLPVPRWALTPPFHPYPAASAKPSRPGGLFSVALSLGLPRPGVTRHRRLVESGLSSTPRAGRRGHPALRARSRLGARATLVNAKARR